MSISCDSGSLPLGNQEIGTNAETVGGVWRRKSANPAIVYFESAPQQEAPRTQRRRQRDIAAAARLLDAAGVLKRKEKDPGQP